MITLKAAGIMVLMFFGMIPKGDAQELHFGLKAGMNLYYLLNPQVGFSTSVAESFHGGAILNIGFDSSNFSIQPEVLFSINGAELSHYIYATYSNSAANPPITHTTSIHTNYSMNFNYLQLPILMKYHFAGAFSVTVGPYIGYLMSAKNDTSIFTSFKDTAKSASSVSFSGSMNPIETMNKLDIGGALGLNCEFSSGLGFEFRYYYGLTKTFKAHNFVDPSTGLITAQPAYGNNNNIAVSLFYLF